MIPFEPTALLAVACVFPSRSVLHGVRKYFAALTSQREKKGLESRQAAQRSLLSSRAAELNGAQIVSSPIADVSDKTSMFLRVCVS